MYFLKNNDKFRKGLSYSIILTGILFSSSSLCAQNFEGTIVGSGNGSVISISESNKFIMDDREHTHTGRYEIVAGGLSESNDNITTNSITVDNKQTVLNLYGGRSNTGSVSKNNVLLKGESTILIGAYAGYTSQGSVFDNTLTLQGKVIVSNSKIRAGYSDSGKVLRNKLILDNISPLTVTYGGFSGSNLTQGNSIEVKNGTYLEERAYGGYSASGKVDSNSIVINDTSRARFLYGGYSANGSAQGNSVVFKAKEQTNGLPISRARSNVNLISDNGLALTTPPDVDRGTPVDPSLNDKGENKYIAPERVNDYIRNAEIAIGGASDSGLVTQNSIDFQSGIVDTLMGGSSTSGKVIKNSIFLKGGITLGTVYGGFSVKGSTNENMIEISDGFTSKGLLIGGETSKGSTVGNKVIVNGGTVLSDVVGGKNFSSDPNSQNAVFINGGKVIDVYGAFNPSNGDINSNQVVISGGEVSGKVYGGFNGVTFEEHPVDKGVYNNVVKIVGGT
ncbi:hypothetical protein [Campylobacter jejuni]|uniref:hypothetical protein n=1 Tax=Campylobacter jejuni TaxID=197 RepID=UPI0005764450|nr:hypothetical protein [Campylobacter jejuni]